MSSLYPILLEPVYQDYIWGGDRIAKQFGRDVKLPVCAESWEVADRPEGMSVVTNGPLAGQTLRELMETRRDELLGAGFPGHAFPLLVKILDARQRLSVQVHPSDAGAAHHGGEPKTEMWYVLDATEDAFVFAGLAPGTTRAAFAHAVEQQALEPLLRRIPVTRGDAVFVPGGTVHAIGEGCLLLEVQQNSNTVYRVYDWGRVGTDGQPRELHVEQAFEVIDWDADTNDKADAREISPEGGNRAWVIVECPHFRFERYRLSTAEPLEANTCQVLFVSEGKLVVRSEAGELPLRPGVSALVPACVSGGALEPKGGDVDLLRMTPGRG